MLRYLKVDTQIIDNTTPVEELRELDGLAAGPGFSMVDGGAYDPDKAYKDSKLCNLLFVAEARKRYANAQVTVNAFSPGLIADPKGFFRNQNPQFAKTFDYISRNVAKVAESNEFGGAALAYLAVDPEVAGASGRWYDSYLLRSHPHTSAQPSP